MNDEFVSYKHSFLLHKMLIDGLELHRFLVDYCDVFISCLVSHSDGTIHCRGSIGEQVMIIFFQISSNEETNSSTSWMA